MVIALIIRLIVFKKYHYLPDIGEIYRNKIQLDPQDDVYENHRSKVPVGKVEDYFTVNFHKPTVNISVPFDAISKNGRFLIINSSNQAYWVKPSKCKRRYTINILREKKAKTSTTSKTENPSSQQ